VEEMMKKNIILIFTILTMFMFINILNINAIEDDEGVYEVKELKDQVNYGADGVLPYITYYLYSEEYLNSDSSGGSDIVVTQNDMYDGVYRFYIIADKEGKYICKNLKTNTDMNYSGPAIDFTTGTVSIKEEIDGHEINIEEKQALEFIYKSMVKDKTVDYNKKLIFYTLSKYNETTELEFALYENGAIHVPLNYRNKEYRNSEVGDDVITYTAELKDEFYEVTVVGKKIKTLEVAEEDARDTGPKTTGVKKGDVTKIEFENVGEITKVWVSKEQFEKDVSVIPLSGRIVNITDSGEKIKNIVEILLSMIKIFAAAIIFLSVIAVGIRMMATDKAPLEKLDAMYSITYIFIGAIILGNVLLLSALILKNTNTLKNKFNDIYITSIEENMNIEYDTFAVVDVKDSEDEDLADKLADGLRMIEKIFLYPLIGFIDMIADAGIAVKNLFFQREVTLNRLIFLNPTDKSLGISPYEPFTKREWITMLKTYLFMSILASPLLFVMIGKTGFEYVIYASSPQKRAVLKGAIYKWLLAVFLIAAFPTLFLYALSFFNALVKMFPVADVNMQFHKMINTNNALGDAIARLMFISIEFKIVLVFIVRKIMLIALFIIAPLACMMLGLDNEGKSFKLWWNELMQNLSMQFFYALAFYIMIATLLSTEVRYSWLYYLVWMASTVKIASILRNSLQTYLSKERGINEEAIAQQAFSSAAGAFGSVGNIVGSAGGAVTGVMNNASIVRARNNNIKKMNSDINKQRKVVDNLNVENNNIKNGLGYDPSKLNQEGRELTDREKLYKAKYDENEENIKKQQAQIKNLEKNRQMAPYMREIQNMIEKKFLEAYQEQLDGENDGGLARNIVGTAVFGSANFFDDEVKDFMGDVVDTKDNAKGAIKDFAKTVKNITPENAKKSGQEALDFDLKSPENEKEYLASLKGIKATDKDKKDKMRSRVKMATKEAILNEIAEKLAFMPDEMGIKNMELTDPDGKREKRINTSKVKTKEEKKNEEERKFEERLKYKRQAVMGAFGRMSDLSYENDGKKETDGKKKDVGINKETGRIEIRKDKKK